MALSNYDTLAVNAKGESIEGSFTSDLGVRVDFYKNWLYIYDEAAWVDGGRFVRPCIMEIQSGELNYKDVAIIAKRGPQEGIYAVIHTRKYDRVHEGGCESCGRKDRVRRAGMKEDELPFHADACPEVFKCMVGCGVYGYKDHDFVGVKKESVEHLKAWLNESHEDSIDVGDGTEHRFTDYAFEEVFRKIPLDNPLRFNQGDAYFAKHMAFETPATEPGQQEPTILSEAAKKL